MSDNTDEPRSFTTLLDTPMVDSVAKAINTSAIVTNPDLVGYGTTRHVQVSELVFDHTWLPGDVVTGRAVPRLVTIEPAPGSRVDPLHYDAHVAYESSRGWWVTGTVPFEKFVGPQGAEVTALLRYGVDRLHGDAEASPEADRYYAAMDAAGDLARHFQFALDALERHGVDRWWWGEFFGEVYGYEMVAVAAFDLIGTVPGWTAESYDALTEPWRAAFTGVPGAPEAKTFAAWAAERNMPGHRDSTG